MNELEKELSDIKNLMERSSRFLTLSGLSGILAGSYALIGAVAAYFIIYYPNSPFGFRFYYINESEAIIKLLIIASLVLAASLATGIWLTYKNSLKKGQSFWTPASKRLVVNMAIPLLTGGIFIVILLSRGYFGIAAPASLIFYGLCLINGSYYTLSDIRYLGIFEIVVGLLCALLPGYGLLFWAAGFGLLHIVYGAIMYYKYEQ